MGAVSNLLDSKGRDVLTVGPETTVRDAIEKMHDEFNRASIESCHLIDGKQEPIAIATSLVERIRQEAAVIKS